MHIKEISLKNKFKEIESNNVWHPKRARGSLGWEFIKFSTWTHGFTKSPISEGTENGWEFTNGQSTTVLGLGWYVVRLIFWDRLALCFVLEKSPNRWCERTGFLFRLHGEFSFIFAFKLLFGNGIGKRKSLANVTHNFIFILTGVTRPRVTALQRYKQTDRYGERQAISYRAKYVFKRSWSENRSFTSLRVI